MTVSYWEIGRRIVEFEQGGEGRCSSSATIVGFSNPTTLL